MKNLLTYSLLLFTSFAIKAQYSEKLVDQADEHFSNERFEEAFEVYDYIYHVYTEHTHYIDFQREVSYLMSEGRGADYSNFIELGKNDDFFNYWMGRIHLNHYEFAEAEKSFNIFLSKHKSLDIELKSEVNNYILLCNKAENFYQQPHNWEVYSLPNPLNGEFDDISPVFVEGKDEILFFSSRPTEDVYIEDEYYIHTSTHNGDEWTKPEPKKSLGWFNLHEAKIQYINEKTAFIYNNHGNTSLYKFDPTLENWHDHTEHFLTLKKYSFDSYFYINKEANHIIFTSESGGQVDLYEMTYDESSNLWNEPVALNINTDYNEDSPYLTDDGSTLYFSSDRPESIGGYDVFSSTWDADTKTWSRPVNVGFPINTIDDDIDFVLDHESQKGYFCSNRLGSMGAYDIYAIEKSSISPSSDSISSGVGQNGKAEGDSKTD